jgi:phage terminase large subunit-like protein
VEPDNQGIYFDAPEVSFAFQFIESLTLTKSTKSGGPEPFTLLGYQKKLLANLLGWKRPDGRRLYRKSYFSVARKNAKTQTLAALALYLLVCDDEAEPEIYMAASNNDQSSRCYLAAFGMVEAHEELSEILDTSKAYRYEIYNRQNGGLLRALSGEKKGKHGKNPSAVIIDELHEWNAGQEDLYDALTTGSQARRQPLELVITTAGSEENSLCGRKYDYASRVASGITKDANFFPLIYELPKDADWTDDSLWHLANPSLGDIVNRESLLEDRDAALASPADQNRFRRFCLNQWTASADQWIPLHEWDACKGTVDLEYLSKFPCYGGLDLASVNDLTAFVLAWFVEEKVYVKPYFWIPGGGLIERSRRDNVRYDVWVKDGHVETTPGNVTDWRFVTQRILQVRSRFDIRSIAFDRWGARDTVSDLTENGIVVEAHGQGYASMNAPAKRFQGCVLSRKLVHDGHPVLRWNVDCCSVSSDPSGNIKPVKPERHKSSKRIDGVVASIMALGRAMDQPAYQSAYEGETVVI